MKNTRLRDIIVGIILLPFTPLFLIWGIFWWFFSTSSFKYSLIFWCISLRLISESFDDVVMYECDDSCR